MNRNILRILQITTCLSLVFVSCGENPKTEPENTSVSADTTPVNQMAAFQFSYTIGSLPSPLTIFDEITKSNSAVDTRLLNTVSNVENYTSPVKQAFNFGIYGVDLAYLVINEKNTDIFPYYSAAKDLSSEIGIGDLFEKFSNRFKDAREERDTLARVVDEAYAATDSYLRSNERLETASMILAGSWLECQHILVNQLKIQTRSASNEQLYKRVWEQRVYLDNISKALSVFSNNKDVSDINRQFVELLEVYKSLPDAQEINMTHLNKISQKISVLRTSITG